MSLLSSALRWCRCSVLCTYPHYDEPHMSSNSKKGVIFTSCDGAWLFSAHFPLPMLISLAPAHHPRFYLISSK